MVTVIVSVESEADVSVVKELKLPVDILLRVGLGDFMIFKGDGVRPLVKNAAFLFTSKSIDLVNKHITANL